MVVPLSTGVMSVFADISGAVVSDTETLISFSATAVLGTKRFPKSMTKSEQFAIFFCQSPIIFRF